MNNYSNGIWMIPVFVIFAWAFYQMGVLDGLSERQEICDMYSKSFEKLTSESNHEISGPIMGFQTTEDFNWSQVEVIWQNRGESPHDLGYIESYNHDRTSQ